MSGVPTGFLIVEDSRPMGTELAGLLGAVGWGNAADYVATQMDEAIAAHQYVVHCRDRDGRLAAYLSVFSDGVATTILNELLVQPDCQRLGIGGTLVDTALHRYAGIPVYAMPFQGAGQALLASRGFCPPARAMVALSLRNDKR